jgi:GTP diphosphokinase / guanosine-3',5'-bis(diphosphate) 3'-diphosphatase
MIDSARTTEYRAVYAAYRKLEGTVKKYRPDADLRLLRVAYRFARDKHASQRRRSGEPYITHPVAVAQILAELEMDVPTLAAGLLHDVVEDTAVTPEEMVQRFGPEVAALVDGVTKLKIVGVDEFMDHSPDSSGSGAKAGEGADRSPQDEARAIRRQETVKSAANLRKIFLAMARDLRVMVIKLADRLHNMRTLGAMPEVKRRRIAEETLQVFGPLAHRLGIWQMKWELEDLAFKYAEPEKFAEVAAQVAQTRGERQGEVDEAITILKERLQAEGITDAQVTGRPKHLFSIYQKMLKQELDFKELFDLVALRVIVHTKAQCYHALGIVSSLWNPIPGMYSDYIAHGKSNMYQSLHIKVMGPRGRPVEVQIRTWDMHRTAEFGVAAHWAYKEKGEGGKASDQFERKLNWLRQQIFDIQSESREPTEFLRSVTEDLFTDQVFVLSPKGDVLDMPAGATPIDFAYRIHSDVGNRTVGAKVNGKMVPLTYQFKNGDVAEIVTRSDGHPSRDWLGVAKTAHAKSKIKAYFKRLHHAESVVQGRELLQKEAERLGMDASALLKDDALRAVAPQFNVPSEEELLAAVGYGTISVATVLNRLSPGQPLAPKGLVVGKGRADESKLRVSAGSIDNVAFRRARCCLPIPGDEVVGYITRGRGMALHRRECINLRHYEQTEPERLTPVDYKGGSDGQVYSVNLIIETADRTGLLADVGNIFGETKTFITAIKTQSHRDRTATLEVAAEVKDVEHLNRLFLAVRRLTDVLNIERALGGREK